MIAGDIQMSLGQAKQTGMCYILYIDKVPFSIL